MVGVDMIDFKNGTHWIRGDLHLHSPLIHTFTLPGPMNLSDDLLIHEYIQKLKENSIYFAAITDYQQIRVNWFKNFQDAALKESIVIFPGIELSVNYGKGIHILLIFDKEEKVERINDYIKSLDRNPHKPLIKEDRSHRDIDLRDNIKDVLQDIKSKFNCLVIFPHPEDKNGIINSLQPKEAADLLEFADAIEFCSQENINKLISTGEISKSYFDNFSIIENTDPKKIDEIGTKPRNGRTRVSYYKLSEISIHALRIAFQDPQMRISTYEKPEYDFHRINWIEIEGSTFLKSIRIDFNKELNCFIGGRGVGKSAILESIRYCLEAPYYSEQSFREDFVHSVVGSGGKIKLSVNKKIGDKIQEYEIERIIGKTSVVKGTEIKPADIFEDNIPVIIGQKELYHLANNKEYLLKLIDQLIGEEIKNEENQFKEKIQQLKENAKEYLIISEKLKNKENDEQTLKNLEEKIKIFQELGVVEKMEISTNLIKDENILKNQIQNIEEKINNFKETLNDLINSLEISTKDLINGVSKEKDYLKNVSDSLKIILEKLLSYRENILKDLSFFNNQEIFKKWETIKSNYTEEINNIKKELSKRSLSADKFENLIKGKDFIMHKLKEYEKYEAQLVEIEEKRKNLKKELSETRHKLFEIRRNRIENINHLLGGRIKINVEYEMNKSSFADRFRELLRGSNVQSSTIDAIINNEKIQVDGIELSRIIQEGKQTLQESFGLTDAMTTRIYECFQDKEKLFSLETFFPEDKISIYLKVDDKYKEFEKLSAGQKSTALLILLLNDEKRILIIDQPEEDLDNRFIYDDVVKILRGLKRKRQIIFATHNANIPVLGDAEQVVVLEADQEKGCIVKNTGSIDSKNIVERIKTIMEGGEEAFYRRSQKYGLMKI